MKAIVWTKFGPPETLQLEALEKPAPKDNEVLIRVYATTVTAGDCELRSLSLPLALKLPILIYFRLVRRGPIILGQELAGEIEAVGPAVSRFKVGEAVFAAAGFGLGAYAEYKCLPEETGTMGGALAAKPANLTYAEAAAVPVGGLEALHFHRRGAVQRGDKMLIIGAGGSIGTMALQLAKLAGAEVTAVDRPEKLAGLRALGADHVVEATGEDFSRAGPAFDVILDVVGKSSFSRCMRALKPRGRYLLVNPGLVHRLGARWGVTGDRQVIYGAGGQRAEDLVYLKELIEAGKLRPVIDRRFTLEQTAEAHRYAEQGHKLGNIVITVGADSVA